MIRECGILHRVYVYFTDEDYKWQVIYRLQGIYVYDLAKFWKKTERNKQRQHTKRQIPSTAVHVKH